MKVEKIDLVWAAVSMIIVGISYKHGQLLLGLILIYVLMVLTFGWQILKTFRSVRDSVAVYGKITDYHESKIGKRIGYYPIVRFETETGREISSVYTIEETKKRYDIGEEVLICYSLDNPLFFYFPNRKDELVRDYYRFIIFGGVLAFGLLLFVFLKRI